MTPETRRDGYDRNPLDRALLDTGPSWAEKLGFLRRVLRPEVETETHTAHVFLAGDRAYKLKKPVRLGYLDFRTLAAREATCREELRLNRELAGPDVYLGLVPLTLDGPLQLDGHGRPVDWLILMRRLPAHRMLDAMLSRGETPASATIRALAARLAGFYAARRAEPARPGVYLRHLRQESARNRTILLDMQGHIAAPDLDALTAESLQLVETVVPDISAREAERMVVDGHGDLRPEHICLTDPPVIFDRLEFAPDFRMIDIGDEVGFLDLECRLAGAPGIGPQVAGILAASGLPPPPAAFGRALAVFRCLTRARLCIDHLNDPVPRRAAQWPERTRSYLGEARRLLAMPDG